MADQKNNKTMHISLWIAQALLAIVFLMTGVMKISQPIEVLAESIPWATDIPAALVRFIGISELLGGMGLLLPSLFRFKPFLSVWAAMGLAVVMILAAVFHASRGESTAIVANVVFMAIAVFVAWGRSKKAPILAKA